MSVVEAPLTLKSGTPYVIETRKSPSGIGGVIVHWGEKWLDYDLRKRITAAYQIPDSALAKDTGFDYIYRQRDGITRTEGRVDEVEVAVMATQAILDENGWQPEEVDVFHLGSGVPVVDDPNIPDYAKEVARRVRLRPDVQTHNTYAACNSGVHGEYLALKNPRLKGKKGVFLGMEGVTALTPDFDPKLSDYLSMQVFSNTAAGMGVVIGEDIVLYSHRHRVIEDETGALAAKMTYEDMVDPEDPNIWQEKDGTSVVRMPTPEDGMLLRMRGRETALFFVRNGIRFVGDLIKDHEERLPEAKIAYFAAHHPSRGVNDLLSNGLMRAGVKDIEIPWVVKSGNSSAATTLTAQILLFDRATHGTVFGVASYGAGGTWTGFTGEYQQRTA